MKQRYLLDGSGFIFRAYHGLAPLTDDQGRNINAIYGFVRMMIRLLTDAPDYFVICRDSPKPSMRKQSYDAYKAHRPVLDDNFKRQIGQIKQCIAQIQIPTRERAWYEADDLIGSLVHHYQSQHDLHCTIVSGDKDLKQLIWSQVTHYDQMKDVKTTPQQFIQEYGFAPNQLLDYLALVGDSSDNVPGVHGIGSKTAQSLVQQYGDLDQIYHHIDHIHSVTQNKLLIGKQSAYQSRDLIMLYDAPSDQIPSLISYRLALDYDLMIKVLVDHYHMNSLRKAIIWLKHHLHTPRQQSLFG
jgi:DNA polymerase-1